MKKRSGHMELEMGERWTKWNYQPSKEHLLKDRSQNR
jgi:hypothetical protein